MNNEQLLRVLEKNKEKYGDITLGELITQITKESEKVPVGDLRIKYTKYYGRGCNELAGEHRERRCNIISFLEELTDYTTAVVNSKKYKEYKERVDYETLEYEEEGLTKKLAKAMTYGYIGDDFEVSYKLKFIERTPSVEELEQYLKRVRFDTDSLWSVNKILK